jgi:hypothetical protein
VSELGVRQGQLDLEEQRKALAEVLRSDLFDRSQNLQRLLTYLCEKAMAGERDGLKEYTVAVEALGRPPSFDQKKDSIVRVEIHRLRKRLQQYYEGPGQSATLQIQIPEGKYVPQFVPANPPALPAVREVSPEVRAEPASARPRSPLPVLLGLGAVASLALGAWWFAPRRGAETPAVESAPAVSNPGEIRILAGRSKPHVDLMGHMWQADSYVEGGVPSSLANPSVRNAEDPAIYSGHREGEMRYRIPLGPGHYELRLHFAETVYGEGNPAGGGETARLFDVYANGRELESLLDVLRDAPGPRVAEVKVYKNIQPAADGFLHLDFRGRLHNDPFVNAIEVRRSPPGRIRPIRMVAGVVPVRDSEGRVWRPDANAEGGTIVKRSRPAENTPLPELFRSERFGTFRYTIPVARDGVYRATLYFHEAWFGEGNNGGLSEGARVFDVFLNHQPLLKNFDLLKSAGGARRAYVQTFHGLKPNSRGKLVFEFEPQMNYACLNAIEIEDESPAPAPR